MNSTMLDVMIDRQEPTELFEQVAAEIRRAIADGEAKPGERLPPARDLAAVLGVNTNTVLRSLRLLRDEGLLEFRRGRGVTVAGTPEKSAVIVRARAGPRRFAPPEGLPRRRADRAHRRARLAALPVPVLDGDGFVARRQQLAGERLPARRIELRPRAALELCQGVTLRHRPPVG